jgi:hypothetical protein
MSKLTLELEDLEIESFDTTGGAGWRGTVQARETFESECQCETDSCRCSASPDDSCESCTHCGCDTPGYTCEDRCYPPGTRPDTVIEAAAGVIGAY